MKTEIQSLEIPTRKTDRTDIQGMIYMTEAEEEDILRRFDRWADPRVRRGTWKDNTAKARRQAVQRLTRFARNGSRARFYLDETGTLKADDFDVEEAERFVDDMLAHGNSPTTANITTRYLAEMAETRRKGKGWVDDDVAAIFRRLEQLPTTTTAERAILAQEDGIRMVRETSLSLEGQGICLLAHGAGLRRESIAGILRGDVFLDELDDGTPIVNLFVRAEIAKGGREYWTFVFGFTEDLLRWLRKRNETWGDDPELPLIPHNWEGEVQAYSPYRVWEIYKEMLRRILGKEAADRHTLHDARRWAGTNFYFMTNDLFETARFMGHTKKDGAPNIQQTVQYVNLAKAWGNLRRSKYAALKL